jgi:hypothetical protein
MAAKAINEPASCEKTLNVMKELLFAAGKGKSASMDRPPEDPGK